MKKSIILGLLALFIITPFFQVLALGTDYRYTGKPLDSSTNLYYYGQRYYDPVNGRFTQPDPVSNNLTNPQKLKQSTGQDLQQFLQNPQALNSYSYTVNNPVKYIDPDGQQALIATGAVGGAVWGSPNAYSSGKALLQGNLNEASNQAGKFLTKVGIGLIIGTAAELVARAIPLATSLLGINALASKNVDKIDEYASKYGNKIAEGMVKAGEIFAKEGLDVSEHSLFRIVTRESRGVTVEKVVNTIEEGIKYFDKEYQNINYFKDGIRIVVEAGKIITVVTQKTMENVGRFIKIK